MHVESTKAHKTPQAVAIALPDDPKVTDDTFMATDLLPAEFMEELVHKDDDSESSSSDSRAACHPPSRHVQVCVGGGSRVLSRLGKGGQLFYLSQCVSGVVTTSGQDGIRLSKMQR